MNCEVLYILMKVTKLDTNNANNGVYMMTIVIYSVLKTLTDEHNLSIISIFKWFQNCMS